MEEDSESEIQSNPRLSSSHDQDSLSIKELRNWKHKKIMNVESVYFRQTGRLWSDEMELSAPKNLRFPPSTTSTGPSEAAKSDSYDVVLSDGHGLKH